MVWGLQSWAMPACPTVHGMPQGAAASLGDHLLSLCSWGLLTAPSGPTHQTAKC